MRSRWQDWVNIVLGAWVFFSPWILQYTAEGAGAWNAYLFGLGIVVFAAMAVLVPHPWEEWVVFLLGGWLIAAPWILTFQNEAAIWNAVILGILVGIFALSGLNNPRPREPEARRA